MKVVISISDNVAALLLPPGQEPFRAALETLALEANRERRMTGYQLRTLFATCSHALTKLPRQHLPILVVRAEGTSLFQPTPHGSSPSR